MKLNNKHSGITNGTVILKNGIKNQVKLKLKLINGTMVTNKVKYLKMENSILILLILIWWGKCSIHSLLWER